MLGPGIAAPDFSGTDIIGGGPFSLSAHAGKVVCLAMVSYTCGHCANEMPRLQNLWVKYQSHNVQMVAVHANPNQAAAQAWLAGMGITFPVVQDTGMIFSSYATGDNFVPQLYIIDRDQIIHYSHLGEESESVIEGHILDAIYSRDPADIEMVMDVSVSMNDAPSGGDSKLLMMKQAAKMVLDFLHDHGQAEDRTGLVWFTDDASEYTDASGEKLVPVVSSWLDQKSRIDSQGTGNCTAMGAGLQAAFDALSPSTQKRFAILLTDGMQNIEPKVTKVGSHYEIIDSGGWLCGGHSGAMAHPGVDIATYHTRVHTIGVGITATYASLLQDLAHETDGFYLGTNDPAHDLDLIYFVDLCNCLAGGSPCIVHHHVGTFTPQECQARELFQINRSIRKITAILSWEKSLAGSYSFWLRAPDGTLLDLHQEMKLYDTYAMATVYLPKEQGGKSLPYVGEWEMIVRGEMSGPATYHSMIIAEDDKIKFVFDQPKKAFEVGDIVPLRISLKEDGKHILQAREIILEKAALAYSVPELLAQYKALPARRKAEMTVNLTKPTQNLLELKLKALSADSRFKKQLLPVRKTFSLREGSLNCQINEDEIILPVSMMEAGLNTFRITINYETEDSGPISRVSMASIHVEPGKANPKRSSAKLIPVIKGKTKGALIHVTPRNAAGQLLGPGRAEELGILLGDKKVKSRVEDLLDGSYRIEVLPEKRQVLEDMTISLTHKDKAFWQSTIAG